MTSVDSTGHQSRVDETPWARNYTVTQFRERFSDGCLPHTEHIT